jgi:hypothetical protein
MEMSIHSNDAINIADKYNVDHAFWYSATHTPVFIILPNVCTSQTVDRGALTAHDISLVSFLTLSSIIHMPRK